MIDDPRIIERIVYETPGLSNAIRVYARDWSTTVTFGDYGILRSSECIGPRFSAGVPYSESLAEGFMQHESITSHTVLVVNAPPAPPFGWTVIEADNRLIVLNNRHIIDQVTSQETWTTEDTNYFHNQWLRNSGTFDDQVDKSIYGVPPGRRGQSLILIGDKDDPKGVCRLTSNSGLGGLSLLAVSHEARRRGFARALLRAAAERCLNEGLGTMNLQTDGTNAAALNLYRSLGGTETGRYSYWRRDAE